MVRVFLHNRHGYVPKVPTNMRKPILLLAFSPPPFRDPDQERLNLLYPVRALDAYLHRAALCPRSDQLFVCFGAPKKGSLGTKQKLSWWVIETITLAYEASYRLFPLEVRAYSTQGMAASKAFTLGTSLTDICDAAGWFFLHTFAHFYNLDQASSPSSQVPIS